MKHRIFPLIRYLHIDIINGDELRLQSKGVLQNIANSSGSAVMR
jgi:hypothetical protein